MKKKEQEKNKKLCCQSAKNINIILVLIFLVIALAIFMFLKFSNNNVDLPENIVLVNNNNNEENNNNEIRRKIDGQILDSADSMNLYPVAIMIENSSDAWPLTGLDKANIVVEAITESSIPRFMALYASDENILQIGPVRSARPYYLDWASEFKPLYMHVGGAPEALAGLKSGQYNVIDLDQFFHYQYYWRENKWRYAPHNVFTSSDSMKKALEDEELTKVYDYQSWSYKDERSLEDRLDDVSDITVLYSHDSYRVDWKYDKEENSYLRYQGEKINKMSDGALIKAKNIIVQVNDMQVIDNLGRKDITTIGEGKAWVFRDGEAVEGTWQKISRQERTKYFDNDGNEVEFIGGTTWIEVIPEESYLEY